MVSPIYQAKIESDYIRQVRLLKVTLCSKSTGLSHIQSIERDKVCMLIGSSVLGSYKNLSDVGKEWGEGTLFDHMTRPLFEPY